MIKSILKISFLLMFSFIMTCCKKKEEITTYLQTTPYVLELKSGFPPLEIDEDNPLTQEGVYLGRHLFWDQRLSGGNSMSCATCHNPQKAFAEAYPLSIGVNGDTSLRNSMVLQNLAWANDFFWDGRVLTLEEQVLSTVVKSTEMDENWTDFLNEIKYDTKYNQLFYEAFGTTQPDSMHVAKAIAQFLKTMVSQDSKFDKVMRGEANFTPDENAGYSSFNSFSGGDCFHCHGTEMFMDNDFHNNGLDANNFADLGLANISNNPDDIAKFKTPTLRNIEFTAPYMHDGRFSTLEEVIEHYNSGGNYSPTVDPLMKKIGVGLQLTNTEKQDLINFLKALSDYDFINN